MTDARDKSVLPLIRKLQALFSHDFAAELEYVLQENRILRSKFGHRVPLTEADRRILVRYGMRIKHRLHDLATIVRPETLLRWHRRMKQQKWTYNNTPKHPGRPRKGKDTEELILRLAEENANWGYTRISGELKKLGHRVSRGCVRDILRRNGMPRAPERNGLSWKQFIGAHMDVTWATDFFTEEAWTLNGLVTFYVLFCIHLGTRRVKILGCTPHPNGAWTSQQARNLCMIVDDSSEQCRYLIHDRDASFRPFDAIMESEDIEIVKTPPQTPKCNAFAERHVRECRETLDRMILFGEHHLRHVLKIIERHHNEQRPHQGLDNSIPINFPYPTRPVTPDQVQCEASLGGLLNHYHCKNAA